jgi:hypothetical protein
MNRKLVIFSGLLAATLVTGTMAYATTVATSKVAACANKKTGALRVATKCASTEKSVPLISGSVQLAPVYLDAAKKPVDVLSAGFDFNGKPEYITALVNGKVVNVNGLTGRVTPVGDIGSGLYGQYGYYMESSYQNPITYKTSDCSDVPFLWLPNTPDPSVAGLIESYKTLTTNPNYPGYFTLTYRDAEPLFYSISSQEVGFSTGMSVYHKNPYSLICEVDRGGDGDTVRTFTNDGYTVKALTVFTGTKLPNFRGPITVRAQ